MPARQTRGSRRVTALGNSAAVGVAYGLKVDESNTVATEVRMKAAIAISAGIAAHGDGVSEDGELLESPRPPYKAIDTVNG